MFKYIIYLVFIQKINCKLIRDTNLTETKPAIVWNFTLTEKLWNRKSCLTYKTSIGTCLTISECQSRNGTVGGLCLGYLVCCQLKRLNIWRPNGLETRSSSNCSTHSNKSGVCFHPKECALRYGIPDGKCRDGESMCCDLMSKCGQTITLNETEIFNQLYPLPTSDPNVCQFIIRIQQNICQIRFGS